MKGTVGQGKEEKAKGKGQPTNSIQVFNLQAFSGDLTYFIPNQQLFLYVNSEYKVPNAVIKKGFKPGYLCLQTYNLCH